jgi:cytochrome oxidase Cu insertion factor (SCO1/SenC/PrrC family)
VKRLALRMAFAALLIAIGPTGHAQPPAPSIDTAALGPQVGTVVPPVSGVDQYGKSQSLATLSGPKGLMLVFSRSADW